MRTNADELKRALSGLLAPHQKISQDTNAITYTLRNIWLIPHVVPMECTATVRAIAAMHSDDIREKMDKIFYTQTTPFICCKSHMFQICEI